MDRDDLSRRLECPVCQDIRRDTPIYSCPNGHNVCAVCLPRLNQVCPVCQGKFQSPPTRNRFFEELIANASVEYCCKYDRCLMQLLLPELLFHERECPHRFVACPATDCLLRMRVSDLEHHILTTHNDTRVKESASGILSERWRFPDDCTFHWPLTVTSYSGCKFVARLQKNIHENTFYIWLVVLGGESVADSFESRVTVSGNGHHLEFNTKVFPVDSALSAVWGHPEVVGLPWRMVKKLLEPGEKEVDFQKRLSVDFCVWPKGKGSYSVQVGVAVDRFWDWWRKEKKLPENLPSLPAGMMDAVWDWLKKEKGEKNQVIEGQKAITHEGNKDK